MARKSGGSGKSLIGTIIAVVLLSAVIFAIARANDISSPKDVSEYFQGKGKDAKECSNNGWDCLPGKSGDDDTDEDDNIESKATNVSATQTKLEKISVSSAKKVEHDPAQWQHWTGEPCNTRETLLKKQGENVELKGECEVVKGEWKDPYTGETKTNPDEINVTHTIPLKYAEAHGGDEWNANKKEKFANDTSHLVISSISKNDDGPAKWIPKEEDAHCDYSKTWVDTAQKYDLTLTEKDHEALETLLKRCG